MKKKRKVDLILLTPASVKKLPTPEKNSYIKYDTMIRGFGCRVNYTGKKTFILNYSFAGVEKRMVIGRYSDLDDSAISARQKAADLCELLLKRIDPIEHKKAEEAAAEAERQRVQRESHTMAELTHDYIEYKKANDELGRSSLRNNRSMIQSIILPRLGEMRVDAVTQSDILTLRNSLKATPYRANRTVFLLSALFHYAIGKKWITTNPAQVKSKRKCPDGIPLYPEEKKQRWLDIAELNKLEQALDAYPDQQAAAVIRLLIETGSRAQEVLGATWAEFDLARKNWTKPQARTKQKSEEHLPLSDRAVDVLQKLAKKKNGPFVFPSPKGTGRARVSVRRTWLAVCKKAGFAVEVKYPGKYRMLSRWKPGIRTHDLRHSFASNLVNAGESLPIIGSLLGHRQLSTTQRYAHIAQEAARAAANKFGSRKF